MFVPPQVIIMSEAQEIFYCYSPRLCGFLKAFGFRYITTSIHKVTGVRFWTFEKTDALQECLTLYTDNKHRFA